jgi:hypothetical protein
MDGVALEGTLVRFARSPLGPYGLTKTAFVDGDGKLRALVTSRRIASITFGAWKGRAKPADAAVARAAAERVSAAADPKDDVPALIFAVEAALAMQTGDAAKKSLDAAIEAMRGLLPEHDKRRLALGDVQLAALDFPIPTAGVGGGGSGVRVAVRLLSATGELLGPTVRVYWRSKSGRTGWWDRTYFTRTSAPEHAVFFAFGRVGDEIGRVAVQLREGERVLATKEAISGGVAVDDARWWEGVKKGSAPGDFVVEVERRLDDAPREPTVWERTPTDRDVEEPGGPAPHGPFAR